MAASRSHGHLLRNTRIHYPLVSREVAVPIRGGLSSYVQPLSTLCGFPVCRASMLAYDCLVGVQF